MLDVVAEMMGFALNQVLHRGDELEPVGMGSPMVTPYGAYPTADGQTAVLGTTPVSGRVPALGADTDAIRAEVSRPRDRSR